MIPTPSAPRAPFLLGGAPVLAAPKHSAFLALVPMLRNRVSMTALATEKPIPVSVIIPALNAAETIDETLQSLRAQSMCDWEAIVVDDGSTDSTSELACTVAQADARLKFVQRHHGGVAAARNHGIRVTAAPWLLFLDADDLITPDHLAKLTGAAAENPD